MDILQTWSETILELKYVKESNHPHKYSYHLNKHDSNISHPTFINKQMHIIVCTCFSLGI